MANKCTACNRSKGKRECGIYDDRLICPRCCGENRGARCEGCRYYQNSIRYQESKVKPLDQEKFVIELDDEIDQSVDRAMAEVEKGKFSKAAKILDGLMQKHPGHHMVLYGMGVFFAMQGQNEKAIEYLENAVHVFPLFMEAYFNLAIAYKNIFDVANMVRALRKVTKLAEPGCEQYATAQDLMRLTEQSFRENEGIGLEAFINGQDEFDRALSLMEKGDWKGALKGFERAIRWNPDLPQPYGNMGLCYAKLGNKQAGLAAFEKALEIDPTYEPAFLNKKATEKLVEGQCLSDNIKTTRYYGEKRTRR